MEKRGGFSQAWAEKFVKAGSRRTQGSGSQEVSLPIIRIRKSCVGWRSTGSLNSVRNLDPGACPWKNFRTCGSEFAMRSKIEVTIHNGVHTPVFLVRR